MRIAAVTLLAASVACGDGSSGRPGGGEQRESRPAPSLVGAVDLTIGRVEGPPEYVFGRVAGVTRDEAGRIFVTDIQADHVRVFSPAGEFLFAFGGSGEGPGEFSGPCCAGFGPDGLLWVRDGGNARHQAFRVGDTAATYVTQRRMAHSDVNFFAPVTFDPAGRLVDIGHQTDRDTGRSTVVRFHLDSTSAVVVRDSIPPPPRDSLGMHQVRFESDDVFGFQYFWQPYGPEQLIAHSPRAGWAVAVSSRYAIEWHLGDGKVLTIERPGVVGPELSEEERAAAQERMASRTEAFGISVADLPFDVPERKVPLRVLHFDRSGRLWVERTVPDGADRRAEIYGRDGERLATAVWPADVRLRIGWIGADVALGVSSGELDVERVVRLRFVEPER